MAIKDALLGVLQQRMDKCTTEQFWAVGAITGLDAFLLTQAAQVRLVLQSYLVIATVVLLALYGLYFIINRHVGYFYLYDKLVDLIKDDPDAPKMFKAYPSRWKGHSISGVVFYCIWVALASGATIMAYR
jgi:hypothetical protein